MSRIFLSHSSVDELEAVALKEWLTANGWDDVFLDLDPERGLAAGERWQEALRRAADRCEAVVFIVTPAWAKSKWCLAEFLLAKSLNKRIFGAILKPVEISELPTELTSEWQLCHLIGDGPKSVLAFTHKGQPQQIEFLADGLIRLRIGLENAGLDARYFPWPPPDDPKRPPYRGLSALEEKDAAIFFGRDAQIVRGLDALRGMRATGVETLFVILGSSATGKSSFLRAGLLSRLKRDDRHFLPLEVIRPERQPITGERGLANAIHKACVSFGLSSRTLGAIKTALVNDVGQLTHLLTDIQRAAHERLIANIPDLPPPTLLLSVDQAEELFNPDATDEACRFLALIGETLGDVGPNRASLIVAFTIRSDRYEPLQTAPELAGLKSRVFDDLKPMPPSQFKEVITGPAHRATGAGSRLEIQPDLVERLLSDCAQGADTLPLLSLTLARLYRDYGSDGDLRLDEYEAMGGMRSVVNDEVESVLANDPDERQAQLETLRAAFIPWLATINPQNDEPMRRVARHSDLPPESYKLIHALVEKRLLLTEQREGEKVIEVAHEALLRQWGALASWLHAEREDLKLADAVEHAAQDWENNGRKVPWLMVGERLSIAEMLAAKPGFRGRLDSCREFLQASRHEENAKRAEEERRRQAELEAAQQLAAEQAARANAEQASATSLRKRAYALTLLMAIVGIIALVAWDKQQEAESQAVIAQAQLLWQPLASISEEEFKYGDKSVLLNGLLQLAAASERQRIAFSESIPSDVTLAARFTGAPNLIVHAIVGIDPQMRIRLIRVFTPPIVPPNPTLERARILALSVIEADIDVDELLAVMGDTADSTQISALSQGLAAVERKLQAGQAVALADKLVQAILKTFSALAPGVGTDNSYQVLALGRGLETVVGKLQAGQATAVADQLVRAILKNKYDGDQFSRLADVLAAVAGKLEAGAAKVVAEELVQGILKADNHERSSALGRGLVAVAGKLEAGAAKVLAEELVQAIMKTNDAEKLWPLGEGLAAVAGTLTAGAAKAVADDLVQAVQKTDDVYRLFTLGRGLVKVGGELEARAAKTVADKYILAILKTNDRYNTLFSGLGDVLAAVGGRLEAAAAKVVADELAQAVQKTDDIYRLSALGRGLAAVAASTLKEGVAKPVVDQLVQAILRTNGTLSALGDSLAAVAGKLDTGTANIVAEELVQAIMKTNDAEKLWPLGEGLAAVTGKLEAGTAKAVADQLVQAILKTDDAYQLFGLGDVLEAVGGTLRAGQAAMLADELVPVIQKTNDVDRLVTVSRGLAATGKLQPWQATAVADKLVLATLKTSNPNHLVLVAFKLEAGAAKVLADKLVLAIMKTNDADQLMALGEGLAAVAEKLQPGQATALADKLATAIHRVVLGDQVLVLMKVAGTLMPKLKLDEKQAQQWIEWCKYPFAPREVIIDAVRRQNPDAPAEEKGFWAFIDWAALKYRLDLKSPTMLPPHTEIGG